MAADCEIQNTGQNIMREIKRVKERLHAEKKVSLRKALITQIVSITQVLSKTDHDEI